MDVFITIIAVIVLFDILVIAFIYLKKKKNGLSKKEKGNYLRYWNEISNESDYAKAIMNCDKLLDLLLQKKGLKGSLGEKLKNSKAFFSDYEGVWRAHKIRNRIAHDMEDGISEKDAKNALIIYKKSFKELGLL